MQIGIKKYISIFHKPKVIPVFNFCLEFSGDGSIDIDELKSFLSHSEDFYFEMQFKVNSFPQSGFNYLMNSSYNTQSDKVGIAVDGSYLYVQIDKGISGKIERFIIFSNTKNWHVITVRNDRGTLSATLDEESLINNTEPALILPTTLGCNIASDTTKSKGLSGRVDNILLTALRVPIAQYSLNTGSETTAYDSVGSYDGTITNGNWQLHS